MPVSGDYDLRNLRITRRTNNQTATILDITPAHVPVTVIEQVLITSVTTRPLSMQEIRDKGILLDSDDYLGFQFTLGMKLESKVVKLDFPVVFDRQNIRPPQIGEAGRVHRSSRAPDAAASQSASGAGDTSGARVEHLASFQEARERVWRVPGPR